MPLIQRVCWALYRVGQELRSILRDLIPELMMSQKVLYTWVQFATVQELWDLNCSKSIRKRRGALCIYWDMLLNVQLQIRHSTLKQVVRSVFHWLDTFSDLCDHRTCKLTKRCSVVDVSCSAGNSLVQFFSCVHLRTCVAGWKCAFGLILIPVWLVTFCSLRRPILPAMESTIQ